MAEKSVKEVVEELLDRVTKLEDKTSESAEIDGSSIEFYIYGGSFSSMTQGSSQEITITFPNIFEYTPSIFTQIYGESSSDFEKLSYMNIVVEKASYSECTINVTYRNSNDPTTSGRFGIYLLAVANNHRYTKIS